MSFIYSSELDNNFIQLCKAASDLIPRHFIGLSCFCKNWTYAIFTNSNCKRFEAGNKTLSYQQKSI